MNELSAPRAPSWAEALRFWLKLGCISFGGPAGQIAIMHSELVEKRRWFSEARFLHALNYCMVLPGPEAQQLATYLGWLLHGIRGGIAAGVLFVLPSMLLLIGLSWAYLAVGSATSSVLLAGVKPAVVAVIAYAAWRMGRKALSAPLLRALTVLSWLTMTLAGGSAGVFPLLLLAAAGLGWTFRHHLAGLGSGEVARKPRPLALIDDDKIGRAHV
jgi:chromate transporter